ncbi:MAG: efflux RND transporter periplasmic adaptor subunit [Candidatus Hydrogenedentes bacterium]|nr:efflux RND transporter periplasmic adaptor subunit [Candidatus Hydrogenedentota bacterium]
MSKYIQIGALVVSIVGMALAMPGCGRAVAPESSTGKSEESAAEKEIPVGTLTPDRALQARCPHGLTVECDECRYEVGVVKVDASLLNSADASHAGLVKTNQVPAPGKMTVAVNITGEVRLNDNTAVHVSPRISGIVREVKVDIGTEVKKDDVLFTVDSVELGQALSDYEKNMALTALSEKNFQREKSLFDKKIGSEMEKIEAQIRLEEYQTALKASEQKLHVLGLTDSDIAEINPSNHKSLSGSLAVRAPIDGTIIEKHAVVGELVEPAKVTMVLADLNTVWVWGGVYERDLDAVVKHKLTESIPVEISVPAYPEATFRGQMNYIGATMDEATRTVQVRTVIDNRDRRLRPGMFCQGRILVSTDDGVLAIPKVALLSDEGKDFVFIHMKDDYFLQQNVTKGREFEDGVEILAGLTPGQTIVTEGAFVLKSDVLRSKMGAGCAD